MEILQSYIAQSTGHLVKFEDDQPYIKLGPEVKIKIRGELSTKHVLFRPVATELVSEIVLALPFRQSTTNALVSNQNDASNLKLPVAKLPLPEGYDEFLCFTNGAILFAGHLQLYGLNDRRVFDFGAAFEFVPPLLNTVNFWSRAPYLSDNEVELGFYFASQQPVVFSPADGTIKVLQPFKRFAARTWSSFTDFLVEEIERLDTKLVEGKRRTRETMRVIGGT